MDPIPRTMIQGTFTTVFLKLQEFNPTNYCCSNYSLSALGAEAHSQPKPCDSPNFRSTSLFSLAYLGATIAFPRGDYLSPSECSRIDICRSLIEYCKNGGDNCVPTLTIVELEAAAIFLALPNRQQQRFADRWRLWRHNFEIGPDEIEFGMGIHGERGVLREKLMPVDEVVDRIMDRIFAEMKTSPGDRVAVLVNSFGSTPLMELYVLFRRVEQRLSAKQVTIAANWIGHYCTSLDMNGASISVLHLDQELSDLLSHPCDTAFFKIDPDYGGRTV